MKQEWRGVGLGDSAQDIQDLSYCFGETSLMCIVNQPHMICLQLFAAATVANLTYH